MDKIVMVAAPVHPVPPRKGAAVEWWIHQVCRRLQGYEPHVICLGGPGYAARERLDGVYFHRISFGSAYRRLFQKLTRLDPFSYAWRAARIIGQLSPALVHVHNAPGLFQRLAADRRCHGSRLVLHMHNEMEVAPLPPGARLFAVSDYLCGWYRQRLPGVAAEVITNGADPAAFDPAGRDPVVGAALRARAGVARDKKIILYVGRMSPEKGPLELLRAFQSLRASRDDVFLLLVGESSSGAGARGQYGAGILDACREIGAKHCHLAGTVDPALIQQYYWEADLVVVPSQFEEPFCMVAIEAMAAGAPLLAAKKGGLAEFVADGENAFFIDDTRDSAGFARRIGELLEQPQRLRAAGAAARDFAARRHSWEVVARQVEAAYANAGLRQCLLAPPKSSF